MYCLKHLKNPFWFIPVLMLMLTFAVQFTVMADEPDPLLEFFQTQRQLYGDIATREQLEQLEETAAQNEIDQMDTAETAEPTAFNETVWVVVIIAAAMGLAMGGLFWGRVNAGKPMIPVRDVRRKRSGSDTGAVSTLTVGEGELDIPSKLPGTWFSQLDPETRNRLLESARDDAAVVFFEKLGKQAIPTSADLKTATLAMGQTLTERVESLEWIESFCGEGATSEQRDYLKQHLKELLIPPDIPDPTLVRLELRAPVICAIAAVGAVIGMVLGGWIVKSFPDNVPVELGYILGAPVVSAAALGFVLLIAANEKIRNRILLGLGIVGGIDTALQIFKGFLPWPILGGAVAFAKRLLLYGVIGFIFFVSRRSNVCDHDHYRSEVEGIIEQWLRSAMAVIAVLTFKVESLEENPFHPKQGDTRSLVDIAGIVVKLKQAAPSDVPIVIDELAQRLTTRGFQISDFSATDEQQAAQHHTLIWEEWMCERYQTVGIIRPGDTVKIEEEPIIRDGAVEQKGMVRKK